MNSQGFSFIIHSSKGGSFPIRISLLRSIRYEGLAAQKRAHEAFIDKLENIDLNEIENNPQEYLQELLEFLLGSMM